MGIAMPFRTLGLTERASVDEVKHAYRELAKRHHPDVNGDDPAAAERFKSITSAYTKALLVRSKRAKDSATASVHADRGTGTTTTREWPGNSPRAAHGQSVDGSRFNVREWEQHHYGMHGGAAQRPDDRVRMHHAYNVHNMARQRAREHARSVARQARRASDGSRQRGPSGMAWCLCIAACATVWTGVANTVQTRFR